MTETVIIVRVWDLEMVYWNLFGAWDLGFNP
jgi:hypothetical protein